MRAIRIDHWTAPRELVVSDLPAPEAGPHEIEIRVRAAGVSQALALLIEGRYQRRPALPFVAGNTAAGEVLRVGAGVQRLRVGDRVLASLEHGALAQTAVAHEDNVYPIPASMPFAEATTLNSAGNSVAAALTWPHLLALQPGQSLLVTGAAGGVGLAAIQLARWLGGEVIAAASTAAKRAAALAAGAHHAVESDPAALRDAVHAATGGRGVERALDPVGGEVFAQVLRCLRPEGRVVPLGFAGGSIPQIPANLLLVKNISVCGLSMGHYKIDARAEYAQRMQDLFALLGRAWDEGALRPLIGGRFGLDELPAAFAQVLDREHVGHVIIEPD